MSTSATSAQQLFLELMTAFVATVPANAGRCDGQAALALACVARSPQRFRLSAWGWRAIRNAETSLLRAMHQQEQGYTDWLGAADVLIRSNTDVRGGSLSSRLRQVVADWSTWEATLRNLPERCPQFALRTLIDDELQRSRFWFGVDRLMNDQTHMPGDETLFTESENESEDEDRMED